VTWLYIRSGDYRGADSATHPAFANAVGYVRGHPSVVAYAPNLKK